VDQIGDRLGDLVDVLEGEILGDQTAPTIGSETNRHLLTVDPARGMCYFPRAACASQVFFRRMP
jgi:hypothetical protein